MCIINRTTYACGHPDGKQAAEAIKITAQCEPSRAASEATGKFIPCAPWHQVAEHKNKNCGGCKFWTLAGERSPTTAKKALGEEQLESVKKGYEPKPCQLCGHLAEKKDGGVDRGLDEEFGVTWAEANVKWESGRGRGGLPSRGGPGELVGPYEREE